jgi:hypothetical protein
MLPDGSHAVKREVLPTSDLPTVGAFGAGRIAKPICASNIHHPTSKAEHRFSAERPPEIDLDKRVSSASGGG